MGIPWLHTADDGSKGYNAVMSIARLLTLRQIPFSFKVLKDELYMHPDFPNITAVIDVLKLHDVSCVAIRSDLAQWHTLSTPFLAHTKDGFGNLYVVKNADKVITYLDNNGVSKTTAIDEFQPRASGIVIKVNESKRRRSYAFLSGRYWHLRYGVWMLYLLLTAIVVTSVALSAHTFDVTVGQLLMLTGCIAGIFLVRLKTYPIDYNGVQVPFCTKNKFADCHAIIHSKQSKIAGVDMASLSLYYFCFNLLVPVTTGIAPLSVVLACKWIGALAAGPFLLYSLYCQLFLFRKVCKYCVLVAAISLSYILWIATRLSFSVKPESFPGIVYFIFITGAFALLLVWIIQLVFQSHAALLVTGKENRRWRRSLLLFQHFQSESRVVAEIDIAGDLVFGNARSSHTTTIVVSKGCRFCAETLAELLRFFNVLEQSTKIVIRFMSAGPSDMETRAAYLKYEHRNSDWVFLSWLQGFLAEPNKSTGHMHSETVVEKENLQLQWLMENKIERSPLVIFDGHLLAEPYQIRDIALFV